MLKILTPYLRKKKDISSEIFYGNTTSDGYSLSLETIKVIANSDIGFIQLDVLSKNCGEQFNFTCDGNEYTISITDRKVRDIRVRFYYLNQNTNYIIVGNVEGKIIKIIDNTTIAK